MKNFKKFKIIITYLYYINSKPEIAKLTYAPFQYVYIIEVSE